MDRNKSKCAIARDCWYLTGSTASGKTAVSLELAKLLDAEIVSLDSMSIYRGMDIGTAKPTSVQQAEIPHHMIDVADPVDAFSVSQYRDAALDCVSQIRGRGKEVLFVGGTALYLKGLLRGLFDGPPADWDFRNAIEQEVAEMGGDFLHQRLQMVDPVSAHQLHANDHRRIIRALEVYKLTGKPISHWQMQFDEGIAADQCRVFTLRHSRDVLHQRIEQRIEEMFSSGLVGEVQSLLDRWTELGKTASQAVGYREVIHHLQDQIPLEETVEKVKIRTRRFARHQETWFRGLSECRILDLQINDEPRAIADQIAELGKEVAS